MRITTRSRYALRFMVDLAEHGKDGSYVKLSDIAARQDISPKYMELIVSLLSDQYLISGRRGKDGGYRLMKDASRYTVGEIIHAAEGTLLPVRCLETECPRKPGCKTHILWKGLEMVMDHYLRSVTLDVLAAETLQSCASLADVLPRELSEIILANENMCDEETLIKPTDF